MFFHLLVATGFTLFEPFSRPELPLVYTDGRKGEDGKKQRNFYPIEVLVVCDNQTVKTQQMTSNMTSKIIQASETNP
jgi:hypothetical protein